MFASERIQTSYHCQGEAGDRTDPPPRELALNPSYSKVQCRVEHVFGSIGNGTRSRYIYCLGLTRSRVWIGLVNLSYNMKRFYYLERSEVAV